MKFEPDYRHFADTMQNKRSPRLSLYEHRVSIEKMELILDATFADLWNGDRTDIAEYVRQYCRFFKEMTYDVVVFDVSLSRVLPDSGALAGSKPGPIQCRADFEAYPWDALPGMYWENALPRYDALAAALPAGMRAVGGPGNGVFELSEDLVGLEYLPFMQMDDPELYADLYRRIGDLMVSIWSTFLERYAHHFVAARLGDDLGFRSSLLTHPSTIRDHILPQYRRVIERIHGAGLPFLYHSCGRIFEIMDDLIALGIDAKHSNEDVIAPFGRWIQDYGDRIALLGGFDLDVLCRKTETEIYGAVLEQGAQFRSSANGYALGSGNAIPPYLPTENYLAMIRAAQTLREREP